MHTGQKGANKALRVTCFAAIINIADYMGGDLIVY